MTIGLNTTQANTSGGSILGEPVIQTFRTPGSQTAIRSITVWRVTVQYYVVTGIHLYFGRVDSTGRPISWPVLLDGPTLWRTGDGVHPTEFRYEFDPPFVLPGSGNYYFALVPRECPFGFFDLLGAWDAYPDGDLWGGSRTDCGGVGWPTPIPKPGDLIFQIEFCATTICAEASEGEAAVLECPEGYVVGSVEFARYGTPQGACGRFVAGGCDSSARRAVEAACLGKPGCNVVASSALLGDPCPGTPKRLAIQATFRPRGPDLVASRFELPAHGGSTVPVRYTIVNRGSLPAGRFRTTLRFSPDPVIEYSDAVLWSGYQDGLAAGDSLSVSTEVTLPAEPRGEVYLGLLVDDHQQVEEQVEVNNRDSTVVVSAAPRIVSVRDVDGDQGGWVAVRLLASADDRAGSAAPITEYQVQRRGTGGWETVATAVARGQAEYTVVAPTPRDSMPGATGWRAAFRVRAVTADPALYFDSHPDSGYSADNLPPDRPQGFAARYFADHVALSWRPSPEPDFIHYRLYRGPSPLFVPAPQSLIGVLSDTSYSDPGADVWSCYKLAAVDVHGNEGSVAAVRFSQSLRFELLGARPHPAHGGVVVAEFMLEGVRATQLELLDVAGRRRAAREVGEFGAGLHALALGDGRLEPGVYFVRLVRGDEVLTRRIVLLP